MRRHVITRRWEDEGQSRASCSCGEQFASPDWILRSVDIADHLNAVRAQERPVRHRPSYPARDGCLRLVLVRVDLHPRGYERAGG
jgi:hypothetical protein